MDRWVPISFTVFIGLAVVITVVFATIYSSEPKPLSSGGPRLSVFRVPAPPRGPRLPANWTDGEGSGAGRSPAGNASLPAVFPPQDLAKSAAVFPVDSSYPELFLLGPDDHDRLLSRRDQANQGQDAAGLRQGVMDAPRGPGGPLRPDALQQAPPQAKHRLAEGSERVGHKILRGDRRMLSGDGDLSGTPALASLASTADARTPTTAAHSASQPTRTSPTRTPSQTTPPLRTPLSTTGAPASASTPATRFDVDQCVASGGEPVFVREEDTRAMLEESLRQVRPVKSAVMRKAVEALMQAYERHVQMEQGYASPPPTPACVHSTTLSATSSGSSPTRTVSSPQPPASTPPRVTASTSPRPWHLPPASTPRRVTASTSPRPWHLPPASTPRRVTGSTSPRPWHLPPASTPPRVTASTSPPRWWEKRGAASSRTRAPTSSARSALPT